MSGELEVCESPLTNGFIFILYIYLMIFDETCIHMSKKEKGQRGWEGGRE